MFCAGFVGSAPNCCAVCGINCMSPMAPLWDFARGLNADSAATMLLTSAGRTLCRWQALRMIGSNTVPGRRSTSSAGAGAERLPRGTGGSAAGGSCGSLPWLRLAAPDVLKAEFLTCGADLRIGEPCERRVQKKTKARVKTAKFMRIFVCFRRVIDFWLHG